MFDNPLLKAFLDRYGDEGDLEQIKAAMRRDGLGPLIDEVEKSGIFEAFMREHRDEIEQELRQQQGSGVIVSEGPLEGLRIEPGGRFRFDPNKCLSDCDGRCCRNRNYLMLDLTDIYRIVTSPYAQSANLSTTQRLFESDPPIVECFMNEQAGMFLPYLRFLPKGARPELAWEDTEPTQCPFLFPMAEVYAFHGLPLPAASAEKACGCILMRHKPFICRMSPLGQCRGMVTGTLHYEYAMPAKACPACAAEVEVPLESYLTASRSQKEEIQKKTFHDILLANQVRLEQGHDQRAFNDLLTQFYNIDCFLAEHQCSTENRPRLWRVTRILLAAAQGDFHPYEDFVKELQGQTRARPATPDFIDALREGLSGMQYSIEPFLSASKALYVCDNLFEFRGFHYKNWVRQDPSSAKGLCQHLSTIAREWLRNLVVNGRRFEDAYEVFYATGVFESRFFNASDIPHTCLIAFEKGERQKGWVIDPALHAVLECYEEPNPDPQHSMGDKVYATCSEHRYSIPAVHGSTIRGVLDVKGNAPADYSASLDEYLPLLIHEDRLLVLARFQKAEGGVSVEYFGQGANQPFSKKEPIPVKSKLYNKLRASSSIFSTLDALRAGVSFIPAAQMDARRRLVPSGQEKDYLPILYQIESTIIQVHRSSGRLTDRIVRNMLRELIAAEGNRPSPSITYLDLGAERLHQELADRIRSCDLATRCPQHIWIGALETVLRSVETFVQQGGQEDGYLRFVAGYLRA